MTNQEIRDRLLRMGIDKVTIHRDGTITAKRSYFYTHGRTADTWAAAVAAKLGNVRIISTADEWRPWPKTSYFVVTLEVLSV